MGPTVSSQPSTLIHRTMSRNGLQTVAPGSGAALCSRLAAVRSRNRRIAFSAHQSSGRRANSDDAPSSKVASVGAAGVDGGGR